MQAEIADEFGYRLIGHRLELCAEPKGGADEEI
jgi:hypothetical protein